MTERTAMRDGHIDMPDLIVSTRTDVAPERLFAVLGDLSTHLAWAGSMHGKRNFGLRTLDAPPGPASVGTEFRSTGVDPMGSFTDRSVVTEVIDPSVFEFVTEGHLDRKKAASPPSDTRITYRFEIAPREGGSSVAYRVHISKWTNAPSMMRAKLLRPITQAVLKRYANKMLGNLTTYAAEH